MKLMYGPTSKRRYLALAWWEVLVLLAAAVLVLGV